MSARRFFAFRLRLAALAVVLGAFAAASLLSCSSDAPSSLGSQNDLVGSKPGTVYRDTLGVFADTVYAFESLIAGDATMGFGRALGYERTMIIQPGFVGAGLDAGRTVRTAYLRLTAASISGSFPARFYRLSGTYAEGDSVGALETTAVVPDSLGNPDRALQIYPVKYTLPRELVQGWIRNDTLRTAMAIVYQDQVNDRVATFKSRTADIDRPKLQVYFQDGTSKSYDVTADATFIRPTGTTSNLIVSDGYVRRVYFRVHIDDLAPDAAVHTAHIRFHIVDNSLLGTNPTVVVYVPESPDRASAKFMSGQLVTEQGIADTDSTLELPLTNAIFLMLQGTLKDNGFVIRFKNENTELRQVEFYGSDAPADLRPQVFITSSTPAEFRP